MAGTAAPAANRAAAPAPMAAPPAAAPPVAPAPVAAPANLPQAPRAPVAPNMTPAAAPDAFAQLAAHNVAAKQAWVGKDTLEPAAQEQLNQQLRHQQGIPEPVPPPVAPSFLAPAPVAPAQPSLDLAALSNPQTFDMIAQFVDHRRAAMPPAVVPQEELPPPEPDWNQRQAALRESVVADLAARYPPKVKVVHEWDETEMKPKPPREEVIHQFDPTAPMAQVLIDSKVQSLMAQEQNAHRAKLDEFGRTQTEKRRATERKTAEQAAQKSYEDGIVRMLDGFVGGTVKLSDNVTPVASLLPKQADGTIQPWVRPILDTMVRGVEADPAFIKWAESTAQVRRQEGVSHAAIQREIQAGLFSEAWQRARPALTSGVAPAIPSPAPNSQASGLVAAPQVLPPTMPGSYVDQNQQQNPGVPEQPKSPLELMRAAGGPITQVPKGASLRFAQQQLAATLARPQ